MQHLTTQWLGQCLQCFDIAGFDKVGIVCDLGMDKRACFWLDDILRGVFAWVKVITRLTVHQHKWVSV